MKQPPLDYEGAAAALRRSFEAECKRTSATAGRILSRDLALLREEIVRFDAAANSALDRRAPRGPAAVPFAEHASRTVARDLVQLRRLARGC
jgi:hypothetical protein